MRKRVPARSQLEIELSWDKQLTHTITVFTKGGELITTLYATNLLNYTGDLLLDSASDLVLDADTVEALKDLLKENQALVDARRAKAAKTYKARAPQEEV